jgi:hypothetical protein
LANQQFVVKPSKCVFGQTKVDYLGHLIIVAGVKVNPRKIESMQNWPQPKTVIELHGFLGLTGYYRKFVKNYSLIAQPLTQLLKKEQFGWSLEAIKAFEELKLAMAITPILGLPKFFDMFVLETHASYIGIGAVLAQQGRPLAYMSKAIRPKKQGWSVYSKEMLAIMEAIRLWQPYLLGRHFQI